MAIRGGSAPDQSRHFRDGEDFSAPRDDNRTHFTGEPPYVGTSGLVLAIREAGCASKEAMPPKEGAAPKAMRPGLAALEEELRTALAPEKEGG